MRLRLKGRQSLVDFLVQPRIRVGELAPDRLEVGRKGRNAIDCVLVQDAHLLAEVCDLLA